MRSKPACWSLSLAGARYSSSSSSSSSFSSHSLSLLSPPPLLRRLQCVLRLVQAKPLPLRNSLGLFLLCSFISFLFLFTLRLFFFCIILIRRLKHSSFLTHLCMLLSCHIKGLNARLFEKIAGVTLHCLDCQTADQALSVTGIYASAKYTLHTYFSVCHGK